MTTYIIAGSSDRKETTICENIARQIKSVYTNIEFNLILKHPLEWETAIKTISKHYGLKEVSNPIIFANTGRPIGSMDDFIKHAEQKFGIDATKIKDTVNHTVNQKLAEKDYVERHREKTLTEQVEAKYKALLESKKLTKLKGFYETEVDKGLEVFRIYEFFVKKTQALAPKIDVPLTFTVDYKKEKSFEDFFEEFCEGMMKVAVDEPEKPQSAEGGNNSRPISAAKGTETVPAEENKNTLEKVPEAKPQDEDKDHDKEKEKGNINNSHVAEPQGDGKDNDNDDGEKLTAEIGAATAALELSKLKSGPPFTLTILNDYVVKDLGENYHLAFHPQPLYEGQCIIFNNGFGKYKEAFGAPNDVSADDNENLALFDFSLHGRKDNGRDYAEKSARLKLKNEDTKCYLNKLETSIFEPLSILDWTTVYSTVKETDSIAFMQLLPNKKKNYRKLSNGIVSIILRQFLLKEHKNLGLLHPDPDNQEKHLPFEKIIQKALDSRQQGSEQAEEYFTLSSLPFNHKICLVDNIKDGLQFKRTYFDMIIKLDDIYGNELDNYGINVILSPKWMMAIPLVNSYAEQKDTTVYLDSLVYLGYLVLPVLDEALFANAKIQEKKPSDMLANFQPK